MGYRVQQSIELQLHRLVPLPPHHFTCRTWDRLGIRGRGGEGRGRGGEGEGRGRGEEDGKKNGSFPA